MHLPLGLVTVLLTASVRASTVAASLPLDEIPQTGDLAARADRCYNSAPDLICKQHGTLRYPKPLCCDNPSYYLVPSAKYCHDVAITRNAKSLGYDATTGKCMLYKRSLKAQKFKPGKSVHNFTYWDSDCFNCLNKCPVDVGPNLLVNGGFEKLNNSVLPWYNYDRPQNVTTPGFRSSQALEFRIDGDYNLYLVNRFYSDPQNCKISLFLVQFRYQFIFPTGNPPPDGSSNFGMTMYIGNLVYYLHPPTTYNATWLFSGNLFYPFDDDYYTGITIHPFVYATGVRVLLDDVLITLVKPTPLLGAPNLVRNPSFEDGTVHPWKLPSVCSISNSTGYMSSHSVLCRIHMNQPTLSQNVRTEVPAPYLLRFYYKIVLLSGNKDADLLTQFGDVAAGENGAFQPQYDEWTLYEYYFVAHYKTSPLYIAPGGYDGTFDFYLDGFEIVKLSLGNQTFEE